MSGLRATWAAVERLAIRLSERDWTIIRSLADCRVLTGDQLSRLHFVELSDHTKQRVRRRVLERLNSWQVVSRLDRVIGGVRAGSTGWVYTLGVAGQRLMRLEADQHDNRRIRSPWTPGAMFLQHSLDIAEIYVQLHEAARNTDFEVTSFDTEPTSWWPDGLGGFLKPDAHLVLSTNRFDELIWLEVDRGTESLPTLKRQLTGYVNFAQRGQLGPSGVMPHVVISTPNERRAESTKAIAEYLDPDSTIFRITTFEGASKALIALTANSPEEPP